MSARPEEVCRLATSQGVFVASWTDKGLSGLAFPRSGKISVRAAASAPLDSRQRFLLEDLQTYFHGHFVAWRTPLDLGNATAFQRRVWQVLRAIPFGEVRSYAWLAESVDHPAAARAVANACGANPVPVLIPCHRIVASGGGLGGFSAGISWKKKLLQLERDSVHHVFEPLRMDSEMRGIWSQEGR